MCSSAAPGALLLLLLLLLLAAAAAAACVGFVHAMLFPCMGGGLLRERHAHTSGTMCSRKRL
jgi:hypothetical protein